MPPEQNSTGVTLPWEKDAMAGREVPDELSWADKDLYLRLRMLYNQYYGKVIDRETAMSEKKKFLKDWECCKFWESMMQKCVETVKQSEIARAEYRKNPCHENAMRIIDIIEGKLL